MSLMPTNPFTAMKEQQSAANPFTAMREQVEAEPSAGFVARELGSRRAINNLMAVPSVTGDLLATGENLARAGIEHHTSKYWKGIGKMLGANPDPGPTFSERFREKQENPGFAQTLLRNIPRPTVEGITAAVKSVPSLLPGGETPPEAMARNRLEFQRDDLAMRDAHPTAAKVGEVGGDILSLFLGRKGSGIDKAIQRVETRLAGRTGVDVAKSMADDINKVFKGPAMQKMARGGVRSLESGVEAAALDILKDPNADPVETAAIAAGGQMVGSGVLQASKGLLSGGPRSVGLNLTVASVAAMGLIQTFKSAVPGGRDRILESAESGFDKVLLTLGVGLGSAAIGATRYGRGNAALSEQTRAMIDGLATVHRGSTLSILSDWTKGSAQEKSEIEQALSAMSIDPTYRGKTEREREIISRIRAGAGLVKHQTGGGF